MTVPGHTLGQLARHVGARMVGDAALSILGIGSLASAGPADITHLSNAAYRGQLSATAAAAVILTEADAPLWSGPALIVADPYLAYARISALFAQPLDIRPTRLDAERIAPSAVIDPTAVLAAGVSVGARARIGPRVRLHPHAVIGADCVLDEDVELHAHVVLYPGVRVGARSRVHAGAVIGADGFGFAPDAGGQLVAIAQLGGVLIGADVRIGAQTTIDRGALDDTVIEDGVKIDNQVQIGHNCRIGAHTVICGCVGLVGSTRIGRHCVLAGGVGVGGDGPIEICDRVVVSGMTHVSASITTPGVYSGGVLHAPSRQWKRNALRLRSLDTLARRVAELERLVSQRDA
ncbi:MAG: UDP-3-O-(3-hydroxymyristoyl)glucosamine N-acyltransferase [Gammaproteobacteria bacterium]